MAESIIRNPFVGCTARDMKYSEVGEYWCSPFKLYSLDEEELFISRTPIVIEGVRGTGKTMILKYLSYFVQRDRISGRSMEDKLSYFESRSLGVYFRYKEDFCNMFDMLNCSQTEKERIFKRYYELFITRQLLEIIDDLYLGENSEKMEALLCSFFGLSVRPVSEIRAFINQEIRVMDGIINSAGYDENWLDRLLPVLGVENEVVRLIQAIGGSVTGWENILFVVSLDEYENLGSFQSIVNTFLKQVDDTVNLTYRVGMRPAGMENNSTGVAHECLQVDRDFLLRRLEYKKISDYKQFAKSVSKKRLENVEAYRERNLCDIISILGASEDIDKEADQIVKDKRHFKIIKKRYSDGELQNVIRELSCDEKLMEMYNILRVSRGEDYRETGRISREFQEARGKGKKNETPELKKYRLDYSDKYRVTLLYMLLTIYKVRKQYYSFNTFVYLSSGSINDYISLCRNTFKQINQNVLSELKNGETISPEIQFNAAVDTAYDQLRKISMSNKYGTQIRSFVDNMGAIFEEYHRDLEAKYPETNQFAFEDENRIRNDPALSSYLSALINSGAIIRKSRRQLKSVGKPRGYIYLLNRIYAPLFQFSYRTRGGYNQMINENDFLKMLTQDIDPKDYVGRKNRDDGQYELFASFEEDDDGTDI